MFDLVTVGHFAIDLIASPTAVASRQALGGSPTYVSLAARKLGARVSVISKVGEDFPNEYLTLLNANEVDLSGLKLVEGVSTTKFILKYRGNECNLQLQSQAPPISVGDLPNSLRARIIHVAPIANELSRAVVGDLRAKTDILSLDPQGFLRKVDQNGNVRLKRWRDKQVLELIDLYKSSIGEIRMVTGLADLKLAMKKIQDYGVRIVVATKGMEGSTLLHEGVFYDVPACKPRIVRDLTGAGDAYIGAFLAEFVHKKTLSWCSCVGSAAASFVVEGVGSAMFGEKKEIYKRAAGIYEEGLECLE
jgi:sugar/nucleoside kinase (ribokinase family)